MKSLSTPVYWDTLRHQDWTFRLAATSDGLCCVTLPNETLDTLSDWLEKHVPGAVRTHDRDRLAPYVEQMKAYLDGRTQAFSVPLDFRGTPFQIRVWRALLQIPFGSIRSYT
ncbi:MAG: cysteine methyltransferase, partial [Alicyclobacillus macrosporangiidus]|uniref:methylated-DNA--[protein]-cysteine S-methyltransferase n=1 Tax=Alicyclobacillus macrosporangiidus TaxID=392015 RepID=UPI0034E97388|nr:cysteine methyltransferase [Alicyclobacillus macrosporangiidus]